MNSTESWNYFDKIYCISVDARGDRRRQARREFARVGLEDRVEFFVVRKHPSNPEQGIFESHMQCIGQALKKGGNHILVFEDDVLFRGFDPGALREACSYLANRPEWNIFFLGCITSRSRSTDNRAVKQVRCRCLSHAYAVNRPFARRFVRERWSGIPLDGLLRRHTASCYALHPMIAFQGLSTTDNRTVALDRMRRLLGGLPFLQKANEFYQNHRGVIITSHLLLLIALALMASMIIGR